jgi:hypothetical protein
MRGGITNRPDFLADDPAVEPGYPIVRNSCRRRRPGLAISDAQGCTRRQRRLRKFAGSETCDRRYIVRSTPPQAGGRDMQVSRVRLHEEIVSRVRGEFLEMPGLRLTEPQARRLWALEPSLCSAILSELVDNGFLLRTRDGAFVRVDAASPIKVGRHPSPRKSSAA